MIFHGSNKHVFPFLILQFVAVKEADEPIFIEVLPLTLPITVIPLILLFIVPY